MDADGLFDIGQERTVNESFWTERDRISDMMEPAVSHRSLLPAIARPRREHRRTEHAALNFHALLHPLDARFETFEVGLRSARFDEEQTILRDVKREPIVERLSIFVVTEPKLF